jgi:structural maintenance of chromosome 2
MCTLLTSYSSQEGMFNNANVIFRTKFVDGVSTVARTIGIGASSRARTLQESQDNEEQSSNSTSRKRSSKRKGKEKENVVA